MYRYIVLLGLALLLPPRRASAQASPEAAAGALGRAMHEADWAGAARLIHPSALRQLRALFDFVLSDSTDTDLASLRQQLFAVKSVAEAKATPDTVLFATLMKSALEQQPGALDAMKTAKITPLGHVPRGADTALVVSRIEVSIEGVDMSSYEVMAVVRDGAVWRGLLKGDFTNMAAMLKKATE